MQAYFIKSTIGTGIVIAENEEQAKELFFAEVTSHKIDAAAVEFTSIRKLDKEASNEEGIEVGDTAYVFEVMYL